MWNLPPSDTVLHLLSYVALTAQAMTAALAAGRRSMDWAGVCMLGCITALGGGTIRDVLLGHYPLVWVQNPFLSRADGGGGVRDHPDRADRAPAEPGVPGARCDRARGVHHGRLRRRLQLDLSLTIVIVAGMITGCAGGVLRDILCNDVPLLFRSELYASVAVATGLFYTPPSVQPQSRSLDRADLRVRPDAAAAGDPLQMGNAEIRLRRGQALNEALLRLARLRHLLRASPPARHCPRHCGYRSRRRRSPGPTVWRHRPASIRCWARAASSRSARRRG